MMSALKKKGKYVAERGGLVACHLLGDLKGLSELVLEKWTLRYEGRTFSRQTGRKKISMEALGEE